MAPTATDPNDLRLALNPARRKALLALVGGIVAHMRSEIEKPFENQQNIPQVEAVDNDSGDSSLNPEQERQRRLENRMERSLTSPGMTALKSDALIYFERWARELRGVMRKTCEGPEDLRAQQRRQEWADAHNPPPPVYSAESPHPKNAEAVASAEAADTLEAKEISLLQASYKPVTTRLTSISKYDRTVVVSAMVLSALSLKHYSAHSRVLLCHLTSSLALPLSVLVNEETEIATTLMLASKTLSADAETKNRQEENASARRWKVGLASVAGAAIVGVTGGIAAPLVFGAVGSLMGVAGLGGVASFLGIFAMNGALVGTLFGAFGGKMTGEMVDNYAREVSDFKFLPVKSEERSETDGAANPDGRRLRVTIGVNGWLNNRDDVVKPWKVLGQETEVFALRYEMNALMDLGNSLEGMVSSYAWSYVKLEILKRTVLATLWSALWPVYLLTIATSVDNPFSVARNRSEKAGQVLADALINRAQGERPVTLIGYSLGARVIYSCLRSLAERRAFGLIEDVILIGSPIPSTKRNWQAMRSVVSGRVTNVYSENDYILAFLYRATSIQLGVAGLQNIEDVPGVDNIDLTSQVSGHLRYPELIGQILKRCGLHGVTVSDDEIENDLSEKPIHAENKGNKDKSSTQDGMDNFNLIDFDDDVAAGPSTNSQFRPGTAAGKSGLDELTTQMHSLNMSQSDLLFDFQEEDTRITDSHVSQVSHPLQDSRSHQVSTPLQDSRPAQVSRPVQRTIDSDSEDDGIVMVDNDSHDDLQMLPGDPIPDDDEVNNTSYGHHTQAHVRTFQMEPKSLGVFSQR